MAANVLDSYLISLKMDIDQPSVNKFEGTLKATAASVQRYTTGMAHDFLKWQGAIVGGFVAAGGAILGMLDHVADADQSYRLMAEHMFISKDAARSLTMATNALGVSLQDAIWDPELHQRFNKLIEDQHRMMASLGMGDCDGNMRYVRDIKFEWQRFTQEFQIGVMAVANDLARAFGKTDLLTTLRGWNEFIQTHMPEWTEKTAAFLKSFGPDFKEVGKDMLVLAKELAIAFQNVVGAFSGDKSLQTGTTSLHQMATAFKEVIDGLTWFVTKMTQAEVVVLRLVDAIAKLIHGEAGVGADLKAAGSNLTGGSEGILGISAITTYLGGKGLLRLGGKLFGKGGGLGTAGEAAAGGEGLGLIPQVAIAGGVMYAAHKAIGKIDDWAAANARSNGFAGYWDKNNKANQAFWAGGGTATGTTSSGSTTVAHGDMVHALALAQAQAEGFGIKGAMPTRNHNPGDIKDLSGKMRVFGTDEEGWAALEAKIRYDMSGKSKVYGKDPTLGGYLDKYTATDKAAYAATVYRLTGLNADTKGADVLGAPITVNVNVANANATPQQIATATKQGVSDAMKKSQQRVITEGQGPYAGGY